MALSYRAAQHEDLPALVYLLANDPLGAKREHFSDPLPHVYEQAFSAIDKDPNQTLLLAEWDGELAGLLQLTFIPNLTYQGATRAQIEGVRVAGTMRGRGIGRSLIEEAIRRARTHGCRLVQLTSDKQRPDALRFYEQLGFVGSHVGFKYHL